MYKIPRQSYTAEFKQEAVRQVVAEGIRLQSEKYSGLSVVSFGSARSNCMVASVEAGG